MFDCDAIRKVNKAHLAGFKRWLTDKGLSKKTIDNHVTNVDFYINGYLCDREELDVRQGCYKVGQFLGYHFIRKAMWSSCAHIKSNAAGFKKFYEFMLEAGAVSQEDYAELCDTIKEEMPEWLEEMKQYEEMDELW